MAYWSDQTVRYLKAFKNETVLASLGREKKSLIPRLLILLPAIARLRMTPKYAFIQTS